MRNSISREKLKAAIKSIESGELKRIFCNNESDDYARGYLAALKHLVEN